MSGNNPLPGNNLLPGNDPPADNANPPAPTVQRLAHMIKLPKLAELGIGEGKLPFNEWEPVADAHVKYMNLGDMITDANAFQEMWDVVRAHLMAGVSRTDLSILMNAPNYVTAMRNLKRAYTVQDDVNCFQRSFFCFFDIFIY